MSGQNNNLYAVLQEQYKNVDSHLAAVMERDLGRPAKPADILQFGRMEHMPDNRVIVYYKDKIVAIVFPPIFYEQ